MIYLVHGEPEASAEALAEKNPGRDGPSPFDAILPKLSSRRSKV